MATALRFDADVRERGSNSACNPTTASWTTAPRFLHANLSTYGDENERRDREKKIIILGGGPNRTAGHRVRISCVTPRRAARGGRDHHVN